MCVLFSIYPSQIIFQPSLWFVMLAILTGAGGRELGDIKHKANSGLDPCPPSCEVLSSKLILMLVPCQIPPKARSTVTGCTEYSGTRPPAPATGPAGTEPPQSSSALVDCSTTRRLTPVTGLRMLLAARNIVIFYHIRPLGCTNS